MTNVCLDRAILWLPPPNNYDTQFLYNIILLIHFTNIALKYCKNDILVQKRNILEGIIVLGITHLLLPYLDNCYIGILVLCGALWITGGHFKYKPLPTSGKAILITGCDRGIGHELAVKLDQLGYRVFAGCLFKGSEGEQDLVQKCSDRLHTVQLDVTDKQQVAQAAEIVKQKLGKDVLWGIVNNAGMCYIGNIETMTHADIEKIIAVNFLGPMYVCKAFLPLLRRSKGRLVNIASNSGLAPVKLMGIYCSSKSALAMMSETLRHELKDWGISVSTVVPSGYRTGILTYNYEATAERWWDQASDDVKQDYGRDCFRPTFKFSDKQRESSTSDNLSTIVETVTEALSVKTPKAFYYRGFLARSLPFLYLHLPTTVSDFVMSLLADWFVFKPKALNSNDDNKKLKTG